MRILNLFVFGLFFSHVVLAAPSSERKKLDAIVSEYTEAMKRADAYAAPYYGVEEDLSKFGDYMSPEQRERRKNILLNANSALLTIETSKLNEADNVLYMLFKNDVDHNLGYFKLPLYLIDGFSQMENRFRSYIDDTSPELTGFPFDSVKHYRDFVKRSEGFPAFVDRQIQTFKDGLAKGYALNCTIAKSALNTYQEALQTDIEKNPFYRPVLKFPANIAKKDQDALRAEFKTMISERILPSFQKFDKYYRESYMPKCRKSYGIGGLNKGRDMYKYMIHTHTDLDLEAKAIHQTGLKEVARIAAGMEKVKAELGFKGTLREFLQHMVKDEKYYFKNAKDMFAAFEAYKKVVDQKIPKYFSLVPKSPFKIVESENPEDAAGSYRMPTDYQPFGRFVVNTKNLKGVPTYGIETLYIHEAIPGHHFQLALQYEMKKELSEYQRKVFNSNAFAEGWALYTERLGRDEGWISGPEAMLGSYSDEMLRAVRLVVDTGIHSMGWSREKTIEYMKSYLAADIRDIEIEADRYSVWPGQALAYKTGQLKILELREDAKAQLGDKFDIREFHKMVLKNGSVSLPVLESVIKSWVAAQLPKKS